MKLPIILGINEARSFLIWSRLKRWKDWTVEERRRGRRRRRRRRRRREKKKKFFKDIVVIQECVPPATANRLTAISDASIDIEYE